MTFEDLIPVMLTGAGINGDHELAEPLCKIMAGFLEAVQTEIPPDQIAGCVGGALGAVGGVAPEIGAVLQAMDGDEPQGDTEMMLAQIPHALPNGATLVQVVYTMGAP